MLGLGGLHLAIFLGDRESCSSFQARARGSWYASYRVISVLHRVFLFDRMGCALSRSPLYRLLGGVEQLLQGYYGHSIHIYDYGLGHMDSAKIVLEKME